MSEEKIHRSDATPVLAYRLAQNGEPGNLMRALACGFTEGNKSLNRSSHVHDEPHLAFRASESAASEHKTGT
jgi:hypothetical protein